MTITSSEQIGITSNITVDECLPYIHSPDYTVRIKNGKGSITIDYAKERMKQIYLALNKIVNR